jgi:hypothetical protein
LSATIEPEYSACRLSFGSRDDLIWTDKAQRDQQAYESRQHIDDRHGVDRLAGTHARRIDNGHIDRLRRLNLPVPGKMRDVVRGHKSIVDAIEAGKPEGAQLRLREHLSRSLGFVKNLRDSHSEYFRR